ncbi:MAG: hypothetical protein AAF990_14590 [Bacteroidota bacterium]
MRIYNWTCTLVALMTFCFGGNALAQQSPSADQMTLSLDTTARKSPKLNKKIKKYEKMNAKDVAAIREAQKESPVTFLTNYKRIKGLKKTDCSYIKGRYHCLYTPTDGKESIHIKTFLKNNEVFLNKRNLKVTETKGLNGHPMFELYQPDGQLYMLIKARGIPPKLQEQGVN